MSDNIIARNKIEIAVDGSGVDAGIAKIDKSIKGLSRSASEAGKQAGKGLGEIGNGGTQAAASVDKTTKNIINSIQRQTAAFTAGKRGSAEYYQSIAALKGANLDALKPYISQLKEAQSQTEKLKTSNFGLTSSIKGLVGAYAGFSGALGLIKISDEYTKFNAQLKLATGSQAEFSQALKDVTNIAKNTQSSIESVSTLYSRLNLSLKDIGVSQSQVAKIAENVGLSLKVAGASAGEASSAMLQLSQAFGSGVLRGEEFNALMESAPNLMRALAESMGVPIGQLRQLASDGKITAEVLTKAFADDKLLESLRQQAKEVNTVGGSFQLLRNEFSLTVGKISTDTGVITVLTTAMSGLADALKRVRENIPTGSEVLNVAKVLPFSGSTGIGVLKDAAIATARIRLNYGNSNGGISKKIREENARNGNNIAGSKAITGGNSASPNFNGTVVAQDIDSIHKLQDEQKRASDDLLKIKQNAIDKAKTARDKANAEILKDIQSQIGFEQDILEAKNQSEINAIKELQKQKEEEYKKDVERLAKLQDIANDNFANAQKESQKLEDDRVKEFEKSVNDINDIFREGFANMVNGGKSTWKAFTKSLVTTFKTTVADTIYKMFAQPFVVKIVASLLGLTATGAASAAGADIFGTSGIAGGGSLVQGGKSIFDLIGNGNASIIGGIESIGASIANGLGGIRDSIGGFIGANSSAIADGFGYAGALIALSQGKIATAIGAGIGTFFGGPIGGTIGSVLGGFVDKLFGGGDKSPRLITSGTGNYSNGQFTSGAYANAKGGNGTASNQAALQEAFAKSLGMLLKGFGLSDSVTTGSMLYKKRGTGARFGATFEGGSVSTVEWSKSGDLNAIFQRMVDTVLGSVIVEAIQKTKLSDGIKALFNGLTDKTQVSNMLTASLNLNGAQEQLAKRFGLTVDQAAKVSVATGLAGDSLSTFANTLASSAGAFNTVGDVLVKAKAQLKSNLGFEVPDSLNAFDLALKNIDKTTQAGIESFVEMFSLREQFAAFTQTLDNLKGGVKGALYSIVSDSEKQSMLNADLSKAFGELGLSVPTSIQELISLGKSIDFTTKNGLDLAAVFPSLVTAFNQTQTAVDGLMNSLRDINEFTTLVDFKRYKGLATNYGNSFANNYVDGMSVSASNSINTPVATSIVQPSNNTTISTSDPNLLQAIQTLSAKVDALQIASDKTAANTKNTADVLVRVSPNGNAIQTELAV